MRLSKWSVLLVVSICSAAFAQTVVTPNSDGVGVYENEIREVYENPIFTVDRNDNLTVVETQARHYKVRTGGGQVGWVERNRVSAVSSDEGRSRTFVFDNAEVVGYLDNPAPVYIMDTDDPGAEPISLDRSFKDALRQNIDRETLERIAR
ncbi:hypothetical protein QA601_13465 [Chitinispirillales bacterium ANBcel5]|uniref:hypothetical protein n=1 Tax=Cellulosispirillum alkaliphilum TaxID=3039283 RepID=UPI002A4E3CF8|nr:hypothetical protein [Chitinispirillales bacterium ANBcel5]